MRRDWLGIAALLTVSVGCGSTAASPKSQPNPTASTQASVSKGPGAQTPRAGLGAAEAAWNHTHTADASQPTGTAYDPDPSLDRPGDGGKTADRYDGLNDNGGLVTDYIERFKTGTSVAAARSAARAELPADATPVWSSVVDGCAVEVFHSGQIAQEFGTAIKDKTGLVLVEFFSTGEKFNAADVERATFAPGSDDPTLKSFTAC